MSQNAISFWIRSAIDLTHGLANNGDCRAVKVKAQEVHKIGTIFCFSSRGTVQFSKYFRIFSRRTSFNPFRSRTFFGQVQKFFFFRKFIASLVFMLEIYQETFFIAETLKFFFHI